MRELKPISFVTFVRRRGGRTPHGVRELKLYCPSSKAERRGRTPHGVRELKLFCVSEVRPL